MKDLRGPVVRVRRIHLAAVAASICMLGLGTASSGGSLLAAAGTMAAFDDILWGVNLRGPLSDSSNTFQGRVPETMTEGAQCVKDFTILSPDRDLKKVKVLDSKGNPISVTQTFTPSSNTQSTNIPLDDGDEFCDSSSDRNFQIQIEVWGSGNWSYKVIPTSNGTGSELICELLAGASPETETLSEIATGATIRFTNTSANTLTDLKIVFSNLDPNSADPVILTVVDVDSTFGLTPTMSGGTVTLAQGSVGQDDSFWIEIGFGAEVDGDLGASATSRGTY